jgi:Fe-S-cluster containining protein
VSRIPLTVLPEERPLVECTDCGRCCTYVGVGINAPTSPRYATDILWYLYHEKVYVYVDGEGEWSVHFEARCRNLGPDLRCAVYVDRPHICRGFDNRTCEVNDPVHDSLTFREPAEFLDWLRGRKPRLLARIEKRFVPKALRPRAEATPRTALTARRRAVARKARS